MVNLKKESEMLQLKKRFAVCHIFRIAMLFFALSIREGISPDMPVRWSRWFVYVGLIGIIVAFGFYEQDLFDLIRKLKSISKME